MNLTVIHLEGSKQGLTETLSGDVITIGRDPSNTLSFDPFKDLDVSTRHASITVQGGQVMLQDLGSTNGTFLNSAKVTGAVPLPNGCMLQFGENGPKVQATYNFDTGPGKKTRMINDLSAKLDSADEARAKTRKKTMIGALVLLLLAGLGFGGYTYHQGNLAFDKLKGEVGKAKANAKKERSQAEAAKADTQAEAKADWDAAVAKLGEAEAAESAEDFAGAKAAYEEASDLFDSAGTTASNATFAALQGQLAANAKAADDARKAKEAKDAADRARMEAQNAALLKSMREELDSARTAAKLKDALAGLDWSDADQVRVAITAVKEGIKQTKPGPDQDELKTLLASLEAALQKLSTVGERLRAAAKAAKKKIVAIRSRAYAIPKDQRLDTTKIRITVAEGRGSGFFASKDGKIVTAKEVAFPELFDKEALALRAKLVEKGMKILYQHEVWTLNKDGTYEKAHGSDKVSVAREFASSFEPKEEVEIDFDNAKVKVTVRVHRRTDSDVAVLQVEGVSDVPFLELDTAPAKAKRPLVLLGTQKNDDDQTALFMFEGTIKLGEKVVDLLAPSFSTWIGGPYLNDEGKVMGLLVEPNVKLSRGVHAGVFAGAVGGGGASGGGEAPKDDASSEGGEGSGAGGDAAAGEEKKETGDAEKKLKEAADDASKKAGDAAKKAGDLLKKFPGK
jgi:pSer/pThr/pTyr-binding forkhead associated (FHA) protein